MTTIEVAARLGYANPNAVHVWTRRVGVKALYKEPGHKGLNVYLVADIEAGIGRMRGRGVGGGRKPK